jgi:hypothetical protein
MPYWQRNPTAHAWVPDGTGVPNWRAEGTVMAKPTVESTVTDDIDEIAGGVIEAGPQQYNQDITSYTDSRALAVLVSIQPRSRIIFNKTQFERQVALAQFRCRRTANAASICALATATARG